MTGGGFVVLGGGGVDPDEAREQARDILEQRRYQPEKVPRPFEGPLEWLGDRMRPIGEFFDDLVSSGPGRVLLALGFVTLVAVVAVTIARRRSRAGAAVGRGRGRDSVEQSLDPARLEREADAAERRGDLDRALRLRFRAGLLRLDAVGAITFRPSMTTRPGFTTASPVDVRRPRDHVRRGRLRRTTRVGGPTCRPRVTSGRACLTDARS